MQQWEYRVVAAPRRGARVRGLRSPEDRFAMAVEAEMNRLAADGWEYVRSDTLPNEERHGLLRANATVSRTLLVFRRAVGTPFAAAEPLGAFAEPEPGHVAPPPMRPPAAPPSRAPLDDLLAAPEPPARQEPRLDPGPRAEPRIEPRIEPRAAPRPEPRINRQPE